MASTITHCCMCECICFCVCNVLKTLYLNTVSMFHVLQIPVSLGVSTYEAVGLYRGHKIIASKGEEGTNLRVHQLILYCFMGVIAGIVGGLLGLGGGFIMGPLFLELGIPPQVCLSFSSAQNHHRQRYLNFV